MTHLLGAVCQQAATRPEDLAALGVTVSGLVDPRTGLFSSQKHLTGLLNRAG
jgi:hypothetical protein